MYVNVVSVTIHDEDAAQEQLEERIVPMVKGSEGFLRAIWLRNRETGKGLGVVVFDTREHAEALAAQVPPGGPDDPVSREHLGIYEIAAEA